MSTDELTAEQVREAIFNGSVYASYDGAQYYANGIDMQAIADELNARLDTQADDYRQAAKYWQRMYEEAFAERTCHNTWDAELTGRLRFQCSECGGVSLEISPRFCPCCGAKVIA